MLFPTTVVTELVNLIRAYLNGCSEIIKDQFISLTHLFFLRRKELPFLELLSFSNIGFPARDMIHE